MKGITFLVLALLILCISSYLTACSPANLMPGDANTGCTRMVSQGNAGGASGVVTGGAKYCKYIEQGDCPAIKSMTFEQLREMCRDM